MAKIWVSAANKRCFIDNSATPALSNNIAETNSGETDAAEQSTSSPSTHNDSIGEGGGDGGIGSNGDSSGGGINNIDNLNNINNNNDIQLPLRHGCADLWSWSKRYRSQEVVLSGPTFRNAFFHPNWSKGTAGVRGTKVLNNGRYYWEIQVSHRVFGTSMMFGIGTKHARLHANLFINLLGEDKHGWGLSHKGLLWHDGVGLRYTKRFKENQSTTIGILFDGIDGTLVYYKDGQCLGVAFRGLNEIREPLYPIVCSTAAKTEMILGETRRDFVNLQDRCRAEISKKIVSRNDLSSLKLPASITNYLAEAVNDGITSLSQVNNFDTYAV